MVTSDMTSDNPTYEVQEIYGYLQYFRSYIHSKYASPSVDGAITEPTCEFLLVDNYNDMFICIGDKL